MDIFNSTPDYKSPIDTLFQDIVDEDDFNARKNKIVAYIDEKKPTTESTEEPLTEGGKKKRKSKKKTKKMKKSKKSKTAKKKKH